VRLARLKRHAQRHALTQQVLLAYDFAQRVWAQAFSEWDVGRGHALKGFDI
jgi:ribosomal protein L31E